MSQRVQTPASTGTSAGDELLQRLRTRSGDSSELREEVRRFLSPISSRVKRARRKGGRRDDAAIAEAGAGIDSSDGITKLAKRFGPFLVQLVKLCFDSVNSSPPASAPHAAASAAAPAAVRASSSSSSSAAAAATDTSGEQRDWSEESDGDWKKQQSFENTVFDLWAVGIDCFEVVRGGLRGRALEVEIQRYNLIRRLVAWRRHAEGLAQGWLLLRSLCSSGGEEGKGGGKENDEEIAGATARGKISTRKREGRGSGSRDGGVLESKKHTRTREEFDDDDEAQPWKGVHLPPPSQQGESKERLTLVVGAVLNAALCIPEAGRRETGELMVVADLACAVDTWLSLVDDVTAGKHRETILRNIYKCASQLCSEDNSDDGERLNCTRTFIELSVRLCTQSNSREKVLQVARRLFVSLGRHGQPGMIAAFEVYDRFWRDLSLGDKMNEAETAAVMDLLDHYGKVCLDMGQPGAGCDCLLEVSTRAKQFDLDSFKHMLRSGSLHRDELKWLSSVLYNLGVMLFNGRKLEMYQIPLKLSYEAACARVKSLNFEIRKLSNKASGHKALVVEKTLAIKDACHRCRVLTDCIGSEDGCGKNDNHTHLLLEAIICFAAEDCSQQESASVLHEVRMLVGQLVKMNIRSKSEEFELVGPTFHHALLNSAISLQNVAALLEEELLAYDDYYDKSSGYPFSSARITVINLLLDRIYGREEHPLERSRILIERARVSRSARSGVDLPRCNEDLAEAVEILDWKLQVRGRHDIGLLTIEDECAVAHCLAGLCLVEVDPSSKDFLPHFRKAMDLWEQILPKGVNVGFRGDPEERTSDNHNADEDAGTGAKAGTLREVEDDGAIQSRFRSLSSSLVILFTVADLLSLKGFHEQQQAALRLGLCLAMVVTGIPKEKLFCKLLADCRIKHLLCRDLSYMSELSSFGLQLESSGGNEAAHDFWSICSSQCPESLLAARVRLNGIGPEEESPCECSSFGAGVANDLCKGVHQVKGMLNESPALIQSSAHSLVREGALRYELAAHYLEAGLITEALCTAIEACHMRYGAFSSIFTEERKCDEDVDVNDKDGICLPGKEEISQGSEMQKQDLKRENSTCRKIACGRVVPWAEMVGPKEIDLDDVATTINQWRLLGDYLESLMQVAVLYEMAGSPDDAEMQINKGISLAVAWHFTYIEMEFRSCLGELKRKRHQWEAAAQEFKVVKQSFVDAGDGIQCVDCSSCQMMATVLLELRLGDLIWRMTVPRCHTRESFLKTQNSFIFEGYAGGEDVFHELSNCGSGAWAALAHYERAETILIPVFPDFEKCDVCDKQLLNGQEQTAEGRDVGGRCNKEREEKSADALSKMGTEAVCISEKDTAVKHDRRVHKLRKGEDDIVGKATFSKGEQLTEAIPGDSGRNQAEEPIGNASSGISGLCEASVTDSKGAVKGLRADQKLGGKAVSERKCNQKARVVPSDHAASTSGCDSRSITAGSGKDLAVQDKVPRQRRAVRDVDAKTKGTVRKPGDYVVAKAELAEATDVEDARDLQVDGNCAVANPGRRARSRVKSSLAKSKKHGEDCPVPGIDDTEHPLPDNRTEQTGQVKLQSMEVSLAKIKGSKGGVGASVKGVGRIPKAMNSIAVTVNPEMDSIKKETGRTRRKAKPEREEVSYGSCTSHDHSGNIVEDRKELHVSRTRPEDEEAVRMEMAGELSVSDTSRLTSGNTADVHRKLEGKEVRSRVRKASDKSKKSSRQGNSVRGTESEGRRTALGGKEGARENAEAPLARRTSEVAELPEVSLDGVCSKHIDDDDNGRDMANAYQNSNAKTGGRCCQRPSQNARVLKHHAALFAQVHKQQGKCYAQMGQLDQAQCLLIRALTFLHDDSWTNTGDCRERTGHRGCGAEDSVVEYALRLGSSTTTASCGKRFWNFPVQKGSILLELGAVLLKKSALLGDLSVRNTGNRESSSTPCHEDLPVSQQKPPKSRRCKQGEEKRTSNELSRATAYQGCDHPRLEIAWRVLQSAYSLSWQVPRLQSKLDVDLANLADPPDLQPEHRNYTREGGFTIAVLEIAMRNRQLELRHALPGVAV
ncbi:hypothetical protein CBR_g18638 [Chara braunii]|uniref:Separase-like TPR repeats region domain-containing protein n=1 Tax=Chara braunii TaxID=69332 RepID=A0A388JTA2_CHABU|nr:hypothetical protein CBR_g18638 [Chara braunii]|eukprot:GBG61044.1 hypothetical protein CBR_g18638 [Chara braunii]